MIFPQIQGPADCNAATENAGCPEPEGRLVEAGGYTGLGHGFCPNDSGGVGLAVQFFASSVAPVTGNLPLETEEPSPDATIGVTPSH